MFVYNITLKVDKEISLLWIKWLREEFIPEIMKTKLFTENKFFELLEPGDAEASTFVMQYFTDSKEKYDAYIDKYSHSITKKAVQRWGNNFVTFKTLMQTVQ